MLPRDAVRQFRPPQPAQPLPSQPQPRPQPRTLPPTRAPPPRRATTGAPVAAQPETPTSAEDGLSFYDSQSELPFAPAGSTFPSQVPLSSTASAGGKNGVYSEPPTATAGMRRFSNPNAMPFHSQSPQFSAVQEGPIGGHIAHSDEEFGDDKPLLEELGIDFSHIRAKTLQVLFPTKIPRELLEDSDLAGPLVFCVLLGFGMLLSRKLHFGYIYGIGVMGSVGMYSVLNLMSNFDLSFDKIVSILGYCLLPVVLLSFIGIVFNLG
eukprot:TRINITY_DN9258_c0_g1_i1.p1 TRINITY_DN9258_c0_g1~~TRINITY_DN9258_c0_g1_i1.p1  ORF type:complete len:265 (+),score=64.82 TRINITY_DN9258_c0_g1_i1:84-878(+)